jgi:3-hydroxybutyrate dehydrogenase
MSVKDKVAVVTGDASGIGLGKEIAMTFVRAGAKVAIADFNGAAATATTAEINARYGVDTAMAVTMDVTNEAQVDGGVDAVAAHFGCLDIMVCNAGNRSPRRAITRRPPCGS